MNYIEDCNWILAHPRSGSTYLTRLLNNTQIFDDQRFDEYFSSRYEYDGIESLIKNPCKNCKVLHVQFNRVFNHGGMRLIDPISNECQIELPDKNIRIEIEKIFNIKYVRLTRNIIDTITSYYIASKSNEMINERSFFVINNQKDQHILCNLDIPFDIELLEKIYKATIHYDKIWNDFLDGVEYLPIDYNELAGRPLEVLVDVLEHFNLRIRKEMLLKSIKDTELSIYRAASIRDDIDIFKSWVTSYVNAQI